MQIEILYLRMNIRKTGRKFLKAGLLFVFLIVVALWWCDRLIKKRSDSFIYGSVSDIPRSKVGLLLGTSPFSHSGRPNLYFSYRIDAAEALFKNGRIKYILVSGDNRKVEYNEPEAMKNALIARGIPETAIYLDYAGFRTLDSVVRCKEVFRESQFTVISQRFHAERAVFLGRSYGFTVNGFAARDVPAAYSVKTGIRESFARMKAVLDIYVLNTSPKFYGPQIKIGSI